MKLDRKLAEAISALAEKGKKKKSLTYEEINDELQEFSLASDNIDDIYEHLQSLGINVGNESDTEGEIDEQSEQGEQESVETEEVAVPDGIEIDDPVRMYLKEIGRVPFSTVNSMSCKSR
jgi:RNA polymerase primary sigma factor